MYSFILTDHGISRAKQRLGWSPKATQRMLPKVLFEGADQSNAGKLLKTYLSEKITEPHHFAKIFGHAFFLFCATDLSQEYKFLTVYLIPSHMRKLISHGHRRHS